jgi:GNAT superfamily N-acetyltransferase
VKHPVTIGGEERVIDIRPMSDDFILWRCLHGGPHTAQTIDQWPPKKTQWEGQRAINVPLLRKLIEAYGTCAMLAWDDDSVVGFLRFYPKAVCAFPDAGMMCLQQAHPAGPSELLAAKRLPALEEIEDKTLSVHCLMTGTPFLAENPYQRKGLGTMMARALLDWARQNGWVAVEAIAYEDLQVLYEVTGQAGKRFWEKLGFSLTATKTEPVFLEETDFTRKMRDEATAKGLDLETIANVYTMRLELV